jgi:hypothetical protein
MDPPAPATPAAPSHGLLSTVHRKELLSYRSTPSTTDVFLSLTEASAGIENRHLPGPQGELDVSTPDAPHRGIGKRTPRRPG